MMGIGGQAGCEFTFSFDGSKLIGIDVHGPEGVRSFEVE